MYACVIRVHGEMKPRIPTTQLPQPIIERKYYFISTCIQSSNPQPLDYCKANLSYRINSSVTLKDKVSCFLSLHHNTMISLKDRIIGRYFKGNLLMQTLIQEHMKVQRAVTDG